MTVFVFNDHLLAQQLALAAKIIATHSFDQLVGHTLVIQLGHVQGFGIFLIIAQKGMGTGVKEDNMPLHVRGNDPVHGTIDEIMKEGIAPSKSTLKHFLLGDIDEVKQIVVRQCRWINNHPDKDSPLVILKKSRFPG